MNVVTKEKVLQLHQLVLYPVCVPVKEVKTTTNKAWEFGIVAPPESAGDVEFSICMVIVRLDKVYVSRSAVSCCRLASQYCTRRLRVNTYAAAWGRILKASYEYRKGYGGNFHVSEKPTYCAVTSDSQTSLGSR